MKTDTWIETFSNKCFYPHEIDESMMDIESVAHSLSQICRFGGHSHRFYSVSEHSIWVSLLSKHPKYGLLHECGETVIGDIPHPVKKLFPDIIKLEDHILSSYLLHFGLNGNLPDEVKQIDRSLCYAEAKELGLRKVDWGWDKKHKEIKDLKLRCLSPKEAEKAFLKRFNQLFTNETDKEVTKYEIC